MIELKPPAKKTVQSALEGLQGQRAARGVAVFAVMAAAHCALAMDEYPNGAVPTGVFRSILVEKVGVPEKTYEAVLDKMQEHGAVLAVDSSEFVRVTITEPAAEILKVLGDVIPVRKVKGAVASSKEDQPQKDEATVVAPPGAEAPERDLEVEAPVGDPALARVASPPLTREVELVEGAVDLVGLSAEVGIDDVDLRNLLTALPRVTSLTRIDQIAEELDKVRLAVDQRKAELRVAARAEEANELATRLLEDPDLLTAVRRLLGE